MSVCAVEQQAVGGALVGGGVVGLRGDLAEHDVWRIEATQAIDPIQQFVGHTMHHLAVLAMNVGMQATEIGHSGRGPHAAKEAVALDQQGLASMCRGCRGRGNSRRSAAQDDDLVFAG